MVRIVKMSIPQQESQKNLAATGLNTHGLPLGNSTISPVSGNGMILDSMQILLHAPPLFLLFSLNYSAMANLRMSERWA